jgi:predicted P-loop ATPase
MAAILSDQKFAISGAVERKGGHRYALRQAERATSAVRGQFDVTDKGVPKPTLKNAQLAIIKLGADCSFDRFRGRIYVEGQPVQEYAGELTDHTAARIRDLILHRYYFDPGKEQTRDALHMLALASSFNSMTDYFDGLIWDGRCRLETMLDDYFGAEDTPFNASVMTKVMVAAIRRARKPGTKFDTVLVFEGPQGVGKSRALTILAGPENFSDQGILGMDEKAQMEALDGVLIFELSELDGIARSEVTKVKALLSRSEDRVRPAYGRNRENRPRTCIFVGTTNDVGYLRDPSGNRRFWPVKVTNIDLDALEADRDQLWAEAAHLEAQGAPIELEMSLYPVAAELQGQRMEHDPWIDVLRDVVGTEHEGGERIFTDDVFERLEIPTERRTPSQAKRIASVMRQLGWEARLVRSGKITARGYVRKARRLVAKTSPFTVLEGGGAA